MKRKGGEEMPKEKKKQDKAAKEQKGIMKAAPAGKIMDNMRMFVKYGAVSKKPTQRYFLIENGAFTEAKPGGCGGGKTIKKQLSL